ncbi:hypothetical protein DPEC_G00080970 [Dallia pectoralis]|uniref:Uncharacterized protein n=1 Tax=Dallia pectoralis TaxID=75939 RepID=A0ACC2GY36_DALPE|nr:hypothetical protein DPEC_G00080970 [Dallia pectoralis]
MSMLAEPRRKQKWSVDPRNSAWSNDESKFGQKMLERMGWSKGKGLGRTEQGSTEHIRVKVKNNQLGLGTTASYEDNWIAHQDDFNQLLADLNNCHGQSSTNEPPSDEKQQKSFSLEEKSKTSRKRVHYMKFTKGKDLSSRSQTDLACIFGKRSSKSRDQEEESLDEEVTAGATEVTTYDPDVEVITKTVTSNLTMQDYFAQRMAQLKKGRDEAPKPHSIPESIDTKEQFLADVSMNDARRSKKKKRKRKRENEEKGEMVEVEECVGDVVLEDGQEANHRQSEKKKKQTEKVDALAEHCSATPEK